ncbi:ABC transporter permease [Mesorhizobium sp. M2A.F.Ca.ET.037.01.1.1]|uniref:ABC transporter permease n=2 Tax=Mesorhizobium TaxID=68287 RepID=UPI000FCAC6F3|nr:MULTISPECIES: ABC transporter permease [unclassified Mesorhizobium]RUX19518.1 ABC transporter permease [Mesorhizobium sp. M2A.F.Ca.ET.037.01.1.1]RWA90527.1 MAG: ABC transporter permease [Mesorhizobium sp.]RWF23308.1 MAG: ABC transporter permease [Mesorhizobium sp.]TIV20794.1 MAG: ABC transporter permease subunit [Mesorhizobium sp.]TIV42624.1 MAG: ABC transporter permease subunit [Mesorhizobium sp.]
MSSFQRWAFGLTVPAALLTICLYVVPILQVLALSFTEPTFGFGNYVEMFGSAAIGRVVRTTMIVSAVTTVLTIVVSYVVAFALVHMRPAARRVALFMVMVPFWVSVLVRAFAWITILRRNGVLNSALVGSGAIAEPLELVYNQFGVIVGMVHYMMPFAILLLYANLSEIDPRIIQAARSLGARPVTIFTRVWLPLSLPGLAIASLFIVIFSLGFLVTPAILGAGRVLMVGEYISVQISSTLRWGVATALSTTLLLVVGLLVAVAARSPALRAAFEGGRR